MSTDTMSPSRSTVRLDGMPCTTWWFTDVHSVAGNPRYPLNAGSAPAARTRCSASRSSSAVVTPGCDERAEILEDVGHQLVGGPHLLDLRGGLADDHAGPTRPTGAAATRCTTDRIAAVTDSAAWLPSTTTKVGRAR